MDMKMWWLNCIIIWIGYVCILLIIIESKKKGMLPRTP